MRALRQYLSVDCPSSTSWRCLFLGMTCVLGLAHAQNLPAVNATPNPVGPAVSTAVSVTRPSVEKQEIRAQLTPRRFTTIAAEIGAKVNRISVQEGSGFKAGQMLVSFDCSIQTAQLNKSQAELQSAQHTFKANNELLKLNAVGQLELDLSEAAVNKAQAEHSTNAALVSKCQVMAPFSGRVAEQKVREQQYVQPGQALLDIIDDSVLELEFLVPSRWLSWLRTGQSFKVYIDETRRTYPVKFIRVGARVDAVSQTVKVAAAVDGRFPELMAGMSGQVQITPP